MRHKTDGEAIEGHDDGESFFQCLDRAEPSHVDEDDGLDFLSDEEEDGNGDDARMSFATAVGDRFREEQAELDEEEDDDVPRYDYGIWMAADEPASIQERRRRLLQEMGLASRWDFLRSRSTRARLPPSIPRCASRRQRPLPPPVSPADEPAPSSSATVAPPEIVKRQLDALMTRCRSDLRLDGHGGAPPSFRRVHSSPHSLHGSPVHMALRAATLPAAASKDMGRDNGNVGRSFTIKDVDTGGKEFCDQSTDEEGCSPPAKQSIRRSHSQPLPEDAVKQGGAKPEKKKIGWLRNIKLAASAAGLIHETKDRGGDDGVTRSPTPAALSPVMSKSASAHAATPAAAAASDRLKVHNYGKSSKDLTGLFMRQELRAHEGSIWSIKFSADGRLLASGGEDRAVRVWRVVEADASTSDVEQELLQLPPPGPGSPVDGSPGRQQHPSKKPWHHGHGKSSKHGVQEHVVVPKTVFALAEKPACVFEGHQDDVLDLSWSKSKRLLSSSMDKTVRLWDMETKSCLKVFAHNDYVTCVQFNPANDGYFISGSLDCKVRIWSIKQRQVVDWNDVDDMVTAACYTPDGQAAIVGSQNGSCRFYKTKDCQLNQEAQVEMNISKKPKWQAKKITGFQFAPGNPLEILVTSADSQIRVFNGITVLRKFKGFKNTSSQISASYTSDGRYVVCASEDSHVYVWRCPGSGGGIGLKAKTWLTNYSYEYFFCRDVSAAVPWPGSPSSYPCTAGSRSPSSVHGGHHRKRNGGVPLPHRPKSGPLTYHHAGQEQPDLSRELPSWRYDGGATPEAAGAGNAWGMVLVTASLGGEIRVYQNFGLPLGSRYLSAISSAS